MNNDRPVMTRNASSPNGERKVCLTWEEIARELWQVLDDIDTAIDMFKPDMTSYAKYVDAASRKRHQYLVSDGYSLSLPE